MGISGKYNFRGIKKAGSAGFRVALASSPSTAWILKGGSLTNLALELFSNWLANKGLVMLNIGSAYGEGHLDQHEFDGAMDQAIEEITNKFGGDTAKLTPAQMKAIDDEVIKVARKFIVIGKP